MKWGVGVLTWNDHAACARTLEALRDGLIPASPVYVWDNGSDTPFKTTRATVVRHPVNLGAGAGLSRLIRHLLSEGAERVVFLENDWSLEQPLDLTALEPLVDDPTVGQVRLGVRPVHPPQRYWTYALEGSEAEHALQQATAPLVEYAGSLFQRVRLVWSSNPFACRRQVAERFLLTEVDELKLARPYFDSGLDTIAAVPGYFRHVGAIRERRDLVGWHK